MDRARVRRLDLAILLVFPVRVLSKRYPIELFMELNYWRRSWPLQVGNCPCDVHFAEYLEEHGVTGKTIFHFGSGEHHILGKRNLELGQPNEILAVTASREEHASYVDFIIENPKAARSYQVLFVDIYTLTPRLLPTFDLVTLFHLAEFYDEVASAYAPLNDTSLVDLFISKLNPGGRILLYSKSKPVKCAEKAQRILAEVVAEGRLVAEGEYKSLLLFACPEAIS